MLLTSGFTALAAKVSLQVLFDSLLIVLSLPSLSPVDQSCQHKWEHLEPWHRAPMPAQSEDSVCAAARCYPTHSME